MKFLSLDGLTRFKEKLIAAAIPYTNTSSGLAATNVQSAVDELNSKLGNKSITEIFPVASSGTTLDLKCIRIGDIVFVAGTIYCPTAIPAYGWLATGLPTALNRTGFYAGWSDTSASQLRVEGGGISIISISAIPDGTSVTINTMYVTSDDLPSS